MTSLAEPTLFAPAERTSPADIQQEYEELLAYDTVGKVLDAMPQFVALLDENRQVVAANSSLVEAFSAGQINTILGSRPGELLDCRHAHETPGGCGTTEACRTCGAVNAILSAQNGVAATKNCQITRGTDDEPLDLRVTATPIQISSRRLTMISISDIANENRRLVLERTFFHDVLNAAGGALGIANVMNEAESMDEVREFAPLLVQVTEQLIEEVEAQRDMIAAEQGTLSLKDEDINSLHLLNEVKHTYAQHPVTEERIIQVDPDADDAVLCTTRTLLLRVVGNMVKNALEATPRNGTVTLGCTVGDGEFSFWVNNPGHMTRDAQLQIFNRSFSTKGQGRGIGTYSIKLLGEKYLGGTVSFESNETAGTTFRIRLPRQPASTE